MRNVGLWLICGLVLSWATTSCAQTEGTIKGMVVDLLGKPIVGAQVSIAEKKRFVGHRLVQKYEADSAGEFLIDHVPWGTYVLMAEKPADKYPDMKLAFYSNLAVPTVTLQPDFPTATVNVQLGPKAGVLEIASLVDAKTGKRITYATITLERVQNPDFSMLTSLAEGDRILVPSMTEVSVKVSAPGYKPWPAQDEAKSGQINLKPEEVYKIRLRLEPEPNEQKPE